MVANDAGSAQAVQQKYEAERQKRLEQILRGEVSGDIVTLRDKQVSDMDRDLFLDTSATYVKEQPLEDGSDVKVLVVGAGIHGLLVAQRLITQSQGCVKAEDLVLVDKAGGWGGTWYWNRYPGVMCDIEGYCYLPLLEETGYVPSQKYPEGYEIREQCERIASKWNLQGQFCTTVKHQQWDESSKRWLVTMKREPLVDSDDPRAEPGNDSFVVRAQFLVLAGGIFPTPHIPHLNGLNVFRSAPGKEVMHTARWDWKVSGGTQVKPDMTKFQGKRVGIIGTGATAVQVVPQIAKWAGQTYVFQRTPSYVAPHCQQETTAETWEKVANKPKWQYKRMENLDSIMTREPVTENLVQDSWTKVPCLSAFVGADEGIVTKEQEDSHIKKFLDLDLPWAEEMRDRISREVKDPQTAEKLKPWYPGFCRRPTFHDSYLSTFNKPNVTLVDAKGQGVTAYTPKGVVANGEQYEIDVLVLATGYFVAYLDSCPAMGVNAPVIGRNGRTLRDKWDANDFGTLFGMATNQFPNLFFFTSSGLGISNNLTAALATSARLVAHVITRTFSRAAVPARAVFDVAKAIEDEYTDKMAESARWFCSLPSCTPSVLFQNDGRKGEPDEKAQEAAARRSHYGGGILGYQRMLEDWHASGRLDKGFAIEV